MDLIDINILISAFRSDAPQHARVKVWLEESLSRGLKIQLFPMVEAGFFRIVTHPEIFNPPSDMEETCTFLETLTKCSSVEIVRWTYSTRERWLELCRRLNLIGNDASDGMLAALAIEKGFRLVSLDEGFDRFPDLWFWNPSRDQDER